MPHNPRDALFRSRRFVCGPALAMLVLQSWAMEAPSASSISLREWAVMFESKNQHDAAVKLLQDEMVAALQQQSPCNKELASKPLTESIGMAARGMINILHRDRLMRGTEFATFFLDMNLRRLVRHGVAARFRCDGATE